MKAIRSLLKAGLIAVALGLAATSASHGQILIDPTGGTTLFDGSVSTADDAVVTGRSLGFALPFFGIPITMVDVSSNGNLNFTGDLDFYNLAMPDPFGIARISPLWDDLVVGTGGLVTEKLLPGVYYSATWRNVESAAGGSDRLTFQVALFGAAANVGGFSFHAGDIAFSYGDIAAPFADTAGSVGATVGLDGGDGLNFAALPNSAAGVVEDGDKSLIPTSGGEIVLFRPDGLGGYDAQIASPGVTAVPEASSMALLLAGGLPLGLWWVRRGRKAKPTQSL